MTVPRHLTFCKSIVKLKMLADFAGLYTVEKKIE